MDEAPRRIRLSRAPGSRKPANTISVGRGTFFGNPFIAKTCLSEIPATLKSADGLRIYEDWLSEMLLRHPDARNRLNELTLTATDAVGLYEKWWLDELLVAGTTWRRRPQDRGRDVTPGEARDRLMGLRGKNLGCWCHLDQPCHADVLLKLANRQEAA